ncbi:MAG: DCC1-like thiol-disulfide oxidoreductase family protein [Bdellovibrionota bacterium]
MLNLMEDAKLNSWTGGQFTIVRIFLSISGVCFLISNWQAITQTSFGCRLTLAFFLFSAFLALGFKQKFSSFMLVVLYVLLTSTLTSIHLLSFALVINILLYICTLPEHPLGSLDNRKLEYPDFSWNISDQQFKKFWRTSWGVWILVLICGFFIKEQSLNLSQTLDFKGFFSIFSQASGNILTTLEILLAVYLLIKGPSKIFYLVFFIVIFTSIFSQEHLVLGSVLPAFLLLFNPAWITPETSSSTETIFYDGECGLCQRWIKLVLSEDSIGKAFNFSPIQSDNFKTIAPGLEVGLDSIVVAKSDSSLLAKSDAIIYILKKLGGLWVIVSYFLYFIPRFLRNFGYDFVAAIRHKIFRKPTTACPIMPPELRERFML